MEALRYSLSSSVLPLHELLVRGDVAARPEELHPLSPDQAEEVFPHDGRVQRDDPHPILLAVVPGLVPGELVVALSPGKEISPALEVVVAPPGGGDGLNTELAECLSGGGGRGGGGGGGGGGREGQGVPGLGGRYCEGDHVS